MNRLLFLFLIALLCPDLRAAIWFQQGNPGSLPQTAEVTSGQVDTIIGALPSSFESVHMYAIEIVDYTIFSASAANPGTSTDFDTMPVPVSSIR